LKLAAREIFRLPVILTLAMRLCIAIAVVLLIIQCQKVLSCGGEGGGGSGGGDDGSSGGGKGDGGADASKFANFVTDLEVGSHAQVHNVIGGYEVGK